MNPVDAMRELAYLYTDAPKNSYEKALAYEAGVEWLKIYQNNAMAQIEKQTSFLDIIPSLIECEKIPEYDVVYLELEEKDKNCCRILRFYFTRNCKSSLLGYQSNIWQK